MSALIKSLEAADGAFTVDLGDMSAVSSISSLTNLSNLAEEIPIPQQFQYHLQDLALVKRAEPPRPDGKLVVHLTDFSFVEVEYTRRETIERFRERVQAAAPHIPLQDYYFVSGHGTIDDGMTLDEYFLSPGAHIVIVRKGIRDRQQLANRRFWLKSHAAAAEGRPRPTIVLPRVANSQKTHHVTPYKKPEPKNYVHVFVP
jgi:hypothetical protein